MFCCACLDMQSVLICYNPAVLTFPDCTDTNVGSLVQSVDFVIASQPWILPSIDALPLTANSPHIFTVWIGHKQAINQEGSNTYQTMNFEQLGKGNKQTKKNLFLGWDCSWISQPKIIVFHKIANLTWGFIVEKHWQAIACGIVFTML